MLALKLDPELELCLSPAKQQQLYPVLVITSRAASSTSRPRISLHSSNRFTTESNAASRASRTICATSENLFGASSQTKPLHEISDQAELGESAPAKMPDNTMSFVL